MATIHPPSPDLPRSLERASSMFLSQEILGAHLRGDCGLLLPMQESFLRLHSIVLALFLTRNWVEFLSLCNLIFILCDYFTSLGYLQIVVYSFFVLFCFCIFSFRIFILLDILWASWIYGVVSVIHFGEKVMSISANIFLPCSPGVFWWSGDYILGYYPISNGFCMLFWFSLLLLLLFPFHSFLSSLCCCLRSFCSTLLKLINSFIDWVNFERILYFIVIFKCFHHFFLILSFSISMLLLLI